MVTVEGIESMEVSLEETKTRVLAYLKKHFKNHRQVYPSAVADALHIKYETVREVFDELEKEGKLQESR